MNHATYSLLTLRPSPERIDVLCVGAVALDHEGVWHVSMLPDESKLLAVAPSAKGRLATLGANLKTLLSGVASLSDARERFSRPGSPLALHDFEGSFAFQDAADFTRQMAAVMSESVLPVKSLPAKPPQAARMVVPQRTRARLHRQFTTMGIMGKSAGDIASHLVVRNYPVSLKHGLTAEFALKNSVMHITETVDFDVADESVRGKTYEAQAKCLVMREALDSFGRKTECHVVISGGSAEHASRSVDLLSSVARLYAVENSEDMSEYFERMARAAGSTGQLAAVQ